MSDPISAELSRLRGKGDEQSLETAAELERDYERDLAKNGSDEQLEAAGYDPSTHRKHFSSPKKAGAKKAAAKKAD